MSNFTFTADSITVSGKTYKAGYSVTPSGSVMVFVTMPGAAETARIRFKPDHPDHAAALAAAKAVKPAAEPAEVTAETVQPVKDPKQARAEVPEKNFIGDTITGRGWRIFFDGEAGRTRVMFDADPTEAARAAVEKAGFYFSAAMNSYNKKLTFKARRAALALSGELNALYA